LQMARKFLFGDERKESWKDPYTSTYIRLYIAYRVLPKKKILLIGFVIAILIGAGATVLRVAHLRMAKREKGERNEKNEKWLHRTGSVSDS